MKKKHFEWMTSFVVVLLSAAMISCSSETDGLEEVESSTSSSRETTVKPSLDAESMKFVGIWSGKGPYSAGSSTNYGWIDGQWIFYNDGTFFWTGSNSYGYTTTSIGKWHYNSENKLLITDSEYNIAWEIIEVTEDSWYGTVQSKGLSSIYSRQEVPQIEIQKPKLCNITGNDVVLRVQINNYGYTTDEYMIGLCYANNEETDKEVFSKLYAKEVQSFHDGGPNGFVDITLPDLREDEKYQIYAFVQKDEKRTYTEESFHYKHKNVPNDLVFMGQFTNEGNPIFWHHHSRSSYWDKYVQEAQVLKWGNQVTVTRDLLEDLGWRTKRYTWEVISVDDKEMLKQTCNINNNTIIYQLLDYQEIGTGKNSGKILWSGKLSELLCSFYPPYRDRQDFVFDTNGFLIDVNLFGSSYYKALTSSYQCLFARTYDMTW